MFCAGENGAVTGSGHVIPLETQRDVFGVNEAPIITGRVKAGTSLEETQRAVDGNNLDELIVQSTADDRFYIIAADELEHMPEVNQTISLFGSAGSSLRIKGKVVHVDNEVNEERVAAGVGAVALGGAIFFGGGAILACLEIATKTTEGLLVVGALAGLGVGHTFTDDVLDMTTDWMAEDEESITRLVEKDSLLKQTALLANGRSRFTWYVVSEESAGLGEFEEIPDMHVETFIENTATPSLRDPFLAEEAGKKRNEDVAEVMNDFLSTNIDEMSPENAAKYKKVLERMREIQELIVPENQ